MNPHFAIYIYIYIYVPKCILLIENLLKKPCSAENSNHYQDAFGTYIYVPKCGFIFPKVPQDSNFSHGFLKTITTPKHYKNQWFLLIISSFLHRCLLYCLTIPKHYKNQWFFLIISSFLHPYPSICSFLHPFLPASPPFCLSPYLPRTQKYPKRTMYLHSPC